MSITLEIDDDRRIRLWRDQAELHLNDRHPFEAFMCAWIAFNFFYVQIAIKNRDAIRRSLGQANYANESQQLDWLVRQSAFDQIFRKFVQENRNNCVEVIGLPVVNLLTKKKQPDGSNRTASLLSLNCEEFFGVLRTIRHNLFHGGKGLDDLRDFDLCDKSSRVLTKFLDFLLLNIR